MKTFTESDLKAFKKSLQELQFRLNEGMDRVKGDTLNKSSKDSSGDLSGYSLHMADQATDNYDREFALNLAGNEQEFLYKIDEALKRIEEKTYGVCIECSKAINKNRLKVVPFAEYCITCQEAQEKNNNPRRR
ncbi:MAG: TraR/DksA C4-type zinc finger protein [Candidatus Omnitrophica bacterium]|jgi:DnaK suppressor protein|nr:TraR/DksA C4-type zinc finger protein [Candidatus Omnitrophota bacterium]